MAKVLVINGENVTAMDETSFGAESELQGYLEKYSALIPLDDVLDDALELVCIGREVRVGLGALDLLYIDRSGLLTIVETKLVSNPEIRREVIGQVIEYASCVAQWKPDRINDEANKQLGIGLDEFMRAKYPDDFSSEDAWSQFTANVERNLKDGKTRLVVAVDRLIEPLRQLVDFLNKQSQLQILILEVTGFGDPTNKVLAPKIFGYRQQEPPRIGKPRINEDTFLSRCQDNDRQNAVHLYSKAKSLSERRASNGDFLNWGVSGYSYRLPWRQHSGGQVIFTAQASGVMDLWPEILEKEPTAGEAYLRRLAAIPSFRGRVNTLKDHKYPRFSTDKMPTVDMDSFIAAVEELGRELDQLGTG